MSVAHVKSCRNQRCRKGAGSRKTEWATSIIQSGRTMRRVTNNERERSYGILRNGGQMWPIFLRRVRCWSGTEKLNRGHRRGIQDGGPELGRYLLPSVCAGLRVISSGGGLPIRRSEKNCTRETSCDLVRWTSDQEEEEREVGHALI